MAMLTEKRNLRFKIPKTEEREIAKHYRDEIKIVEAKRLDGATGIIDFVSYQ